MKVSTIGLLLAPVLLVFFYLSYLHPLTSTPSAEEDLLNSSSDSSAWRNGNLNHYPNNNNKDFILTKKPTATRVGPTLIKKPSGGGDARANETTLEDLLNQMAFDDSHMKDSVWEPYKAFHKKMLAKGVSSSSRYAVYECHGGCGGMGDRVSGMIAVFWFSILTDRAFLIDWSTPFDFTEFFESPLEWKYKPAIEKHAQSFSFIDWSPDGISGMQANNLKIRTNVFNLKLAVWKDQESVNRIEKLGFSRSNRHNFRLLSNFLFKPQPFVQKAIDEFKSKSGWNSANGTKVIGLQIRTGSGVSEGERVSKKGVQMFFECARRVTQQYFAGEHVKWYLTTDSYQVEEDAIKEYGDLVMVYKGKIAHTDKGGGGAAGTEDAKLAGLKTTADWWMLGETDFNIISRSMFGWTASWKSGHPWVIGDGNCRVIGPELSVIADPPFPRPPTCGKGLHEKCHMQLEPKPTDWEIGQSL